MKRQVFRIIPVVVTFLALVVGFFSVRPTLGTQAASSDNQRFINGSQITCGQWNRVPNDLNNSAFNTALFGVVGISVNDAWAVGFMDISSSPINRQPLMMHWNGTRWKSVLSPTLSGTFHELHGVAAISTSDVWAVGEESSSSGQALMEHWDGTSWSEVAAPTAGVASVLYSVTRVPRTNNLWAVGYYSSNYSNYALLEYWDGTQWTIFSSPTIPSNNATLQSVTAFSSTDAWAVGWFNSPTLGEQTLIEHWDGTQWSVIPSPNTSSSDLLYSVTPVPNTNELWAVGLDSSGRYERTLIEHWDGSTWSLSSGVDGTGNNVLFGTVARAVNDVWSVGYVKNGKSLIQHWDGVQWSVVAQPTSNVFYSSLWAIAAVPNQSTMWAVGFTYSSKIKIYHPLILLYC